MTFYCKNDWRTWILIYIGSHAFVSWLQGRVDLFVWMLVVWYLINHRIFENTDNAVSRRTALLGATVSLAALGMVVSIWMGTVNVLLISPGLIGVVALSCYLWRRAEAPEALPKLWLNATVMLVGACVLGLVYWWMPEATFLHLLVVNSCMLAASMGLYSQCKVVVHPEYEEDGMVVQSVTFIPKDGTALAKVRSIAGTPAVLAGVMVVTVELVLHALWVGGSF